jgi:hypothetical protein
MLPGFVYREKLQLLDPPFLWFPEMLFCCDAGIGEQALMEITE